MKNRDGDGAREPTASSKKLGDIGGRKGGTDSISHAKEKVGMVQSREMTRWN